jgi:HD-GYP domain-containing protein (c-di-GMP phosphodiesterase class II)
VCVLAIAFGQRLGLSRSQLAQLGLCALYHDMGKLSIPLDILEKHGPLSDQEWAVMGNHCVYGARTLFPMIAGDRGTVKRILSALQHHRGFNGGGYPKLELLDQQNLFVRIVAIADAFDAMTTKRVYQKQYLPAEALAIMHGEAGTRYDPLLIKAFINCMGVFPVGSLVQLKTGELAVVCESSPDPELPDRPVVKVVTDANQVAVEPELIDLSLPDQASREIIRSVDPDQFGINCATYAI